MREYSIKRLIEEYPFALEFIEQNRLDISLCYTDSISD